MPVRDFRRNSFYETILQLEYTCSPDLFAQACVEHFHDLQLDDFGYRLTQVFEPGVLKEIALLDDRPYQPLADLEDCPGPGIARLAGLASHAHDLTLPGLINVATALISVCRFGPAVRLLDLASARAVSPRDRFEIAMAEFMVSNRRDDGAGSPAAFSKIREAIEFGQIPRERIIDASSQAVVWYLKRKELSESDFRWFVKAGASMIKNAAQVDPTTRSAWHRAVAMIPAGRKQAGSTRQYMMRAQDAAHEAIAKRPGAYEKNFIKTYYESALKEHMYLTNDHDKAMQAGHALIELDPLWAPSYGELAEAYDRFGDKQRAAQLYEQAADLGPPYVGHHLLRAARCHEALGNLGEAVSHYLTLADLAPRNEAVLTAGLRVAQKASHDARTRFERGLATITSGPAAPGNDRR